MSIVIVQGGQTGVDRGAWLGARDAKLARRGDMPANMRDERGIIPDEVRVDLWPRGTLAQRTIANVRSSVALVCVVPEAWSYRLEGRSRGTLLAWTTARARDVFVSRLMVCGPLDHERLYEFLESVEHYLGDDYHREMWRLMVAGPRASRWPEGEARARAVVRQIAAAYRGEEHVPS